MAAEEREGDGDGAGDGGAPPALAAGAIVGRYRIIQLIGRGGMGVVYRVEHVDLGMLRALKTLAPELAHHPRARSRFLKEAKAAARIEHPHVVKVFDCGEHEGIPFFVMDHLDGEDLETLLTRSTLTAEQTAGIMLAICAAISEMHQEGIIHRDLKPGNIFLARNKVRDIVPTVLDFGIARAIERGPSATRTQDGVIVGTPHYIAPEQLLDLPASELTDQYALGVVLYRCVTGMLPFTGDQTMSIYRRIATFEPARPREICPELPAAFEDLVLRAMSERPADRFASMYELGKALLPFASPKHRAVWFDYYDHQRSPQGLVSMPIPVAESAAWWARVPAGLAMGRGATESLEMSAGGRRLSVDGEKVPVARTIPFAIERTLLAPAAGGTEPYPVRAVPHAPTPRPDPSRVGFSERGSFAEGRQSVLRRRMVYLVAGLAAAALAVGVIFSRLPVRAERPTGGTSALRLPRSASAPDPVPTPVVRVTEESGASEPTLEPPKATRSVRLVSEGVIAKSRSHSQRTSSRRSGSRTASDDDEQDAPPRGALPAAKPSSDYPAVRDPALSLYPAVR